MRWDDLFADLEGGVESMEQQERDADIAERTRAHLGTVRWVDRCVGARLGLRIVGIGLVEGDVDTVTRDWLLMHVDGRSDWVINLDAVCGVVGAPPTASTAGTRSAVAARMTWVNAWSVLSRDRARVQVVRTDGTHLAGLAARVGRDFVEMRCADDFGAEDRRRGERLEIVPYRAIAAVKCPR